MVNVKDGIIVIDFGGQYAHLIRRRVREMGVRCELEKFDVEYEEIKNSGARGIILSGGPSSVVGRNPAFLGFDVRKLGVPILGVCYGHQYIAEHFGGKTVTGKAGEYGSSEVEVMKKNVLFQNLPSRFSAWFSHADRVETIPRGFVRIARSEKDENSAFANDRLRIYTVQFHPEVSQTSFGKRLLHNFVFKVCGCQSHGSREDVISEIVQDIRQKVGDSRAICAVSGGVDSTTAALLTKMAIGDRLSCVFVNHGLLRKHEEEDVLRLLRENLGIKVEYVDASVRFLEALKGISDPEEKRPRIGENFATVFEEFSRQQPGTEWLVQGTLYPDVVESTTPYPGSSRIKSHHNVAGLPKKLGLKVLEPLRDMYKDEVRKIALKLGIPRNFAYRHPFPGPGLAVRVIGEVTPVKLNICREAGYIFERELVSSGAYRKLWQAFAFVGDDRVVGVAGDNRRHGYMVTLRAVKSEDGMTASYAKLPWSLLDKVSREVTNTLPDVSMVCYSLSNKPPSTIEPQ